MIKLTELVNWSMLEKKFDIASLTPNMDEKGIYSHLILNLFRKRLQTLRKMRLN